MKTSIAMLLPAVIKAGESARKGQKNVTHTYKDDGSILTEIDTELNAFLCGEIRRLFPDANIISEEESSEFDPGKSLTFSVDPIDGTDSFAQGHPGWSISLGVLDADLNPIGGILYSPGWSTSSSAETLIVADIGEQPTLNGELIRINQDSVISVEESQVMISSTLHRKYSIRRYPGKVRYAGCAVLNILSVLMYERVSCALITPLHIWDITAAHAVLKALGMNLEYLSGEKVSYRELVDRSRTKSLILAGNQDLISTTRSYIDKVADPA